MELEQQVTSLELSKRLKELGVKQESLFYHFAEEIEEDGLAWWTIAEKEPRKGKKVREYLESVGRPSVLSAFTVAELGEMLPPGLWFEKTEEDKRYRVGFIKQLDGVSPSHVEYGDTEADARAKMLIYLLENNLLTLEERK